MAALWYMLDQSNKGFTWESFTDYLKNLVSSTITTLDAAAFVAPILFSIYIGLGLIWSAASMGSAIIVIEEHIKVKNLYFFQLSDSQGLILYLDFSS